MFGRRPVSMACDFKNSGSIRRGKKKESSNLMSQADYYSILGVSQEASSEDIKKVYRKLALETHPDRNPGDAGAEERFKKISEAYGVLIDPQKRAQYDQYRQFGMAGGRGGAAGPGFAYSQEEIFRDFFNSRYAQDIFGDMQREFQRMGFRFDDTFFNRLFFSEKPIIFQGIFWSGPGGTRVIRFGDVGKAAGARRTEGSGSSFREEAPVGELKPKGLLETGVSLLAKAGKKVGGYVLKKALGWITGSSGEPRDAQTAQAQGGSSSDVMYELVISSVDALRGASVEVGIPHLENGRKVTVRIPPGVHSGTRLRLRELGRPLPQALHRRGDLYLELRVE